MAKTEQTVTGAAPSFTYTGGGWTTAQADTPASGGSYAFNSTAGQSVAINVPTGKYGILIGVLMPPAAGVVAVAVDGGVATNYALSNGATTNHQNYFWYQATLPPIYFANTGTTHTVTLTNISGTIYVDFVEMYDTTAIYTAGTLEGDGHSILYGFNSLSGSTTLNVSAPLASTFVAEAARILGLTATNRGIPGEDLTNGGNSASNPQFSSNSYSPEPGWRRFATGTAAGPYTWANGAGNSGAPYTVAAANTAWGFGAEVALVMHGFNDWPLELICDIGAGAAAGSPAGAGWALKRFVQRLKEYCWRRNLATKKQGLTILCGISYSTNVSLTSDILSRWNAAIAAVAADPTIVGAIYVDTWSALKQIVSGGLQDTAHPTGVGQLAMAPTIAARALAGRRTQLARAR